MTTLRIVLALCLGLYLGAKIGRDAVDGQWVKATVVAGDTVEVTIKDGRIAFRVEPHSSSVEYDAKTG